MVNIIGEGGQVSYRIGVEDKSEITYGGIKGEIDRIDALFESYPDLKILMGKYKVSVESQNGKSYIVIHMLKDGKYVPSSKNIELVLQDIFDKNKKPYILSAILGHLKKNINLSGKTINLAELVKEAKAKFEKSPGKKDAIALGKAVVNAIPQEKIDAQNKIYTEHKKFSLWNDPLKLKEKITAAYKDIVSPKAKETPKPKEASKSADSPTTPPTPPKAEKKDEEKQKTAAAKKQTQSNPVTLPKGKKGWVENTPAGQLIIYYKNADGKEGLDINNEEEMNSFEVYVDNNQNGEVDEGDEKIDKDGLSKQLARAALNFMKANGKLEKGTLDDEKIREFARVVAKYAQKYGLTLAQALQLYLSSPAFKNENLDAVGDTSNRIAGMLDAGKIKQLIDADNNKRIELIAEWTGFKRSIVEAQVRGIKDWSSVTAKQIAIAFVRIPEFLRLQNAENRKVLEEIFGIKYADVQDLKPYPAEVKYTEGKLLGWLEGIEVEKEDSNEVEEEGFADRIEGKSDQKLLDLAKKHALKRINVDQEELLFVMSDLTESGYVKRKSKTDNTLVWDDSVEKKSNYKKLKGKWDKLVKPYLRAKKKEEVLYKRLVESNDPEIKNYARIQLAKSYLDQAAVTAGNDISAQMKAARAGKILKEVTKEGNAPPLLKAEAYIWLKEIGKAEEELAKLYDSKKEEFKDGVKGHEKAVVLFLLAQTKAPDKKERATLEDNIKYLKYISLLKKAEELFPQMSDSDPMKIHIQKIIEKFNENEIVKELLPGMLEFELALMEMDLDKLTIALPLYKEAIQTKIQEIKGKDSPEEKDKEKLYSYYLNLYQIHRNLGEYAEAEKVAKMCGETQRILNKQDEIDWKEEIENCGNLKGIFKHAGKRAETGGIVLKNFTSYTIKAKKYAYLKKSFAHKSYKRMALYAAIEFLRRANEAKKSDKFRIFWKKTKVKGLAIHKDFKLRGFFGDKIKKGKKKNKGKKLPGSLLIPKLKPYLTDLDRLTAYFKVIIENKLGDIKKEK